MSKAASTDRHIWIDMGVVSSQTPEAVGEAMQGLINAAPLGTSSTKKKLFDGFKPFQKICSTSWIIQSHPKTSKVIQRLWLKVCWGWNHQQDEKNVSPSWAACDFQLAIYVVLLSVAPRDETGKLRSCSVQRVMCGCVRVYTPYTTETPKKKRVATYAEILKVPFILYIMIYNFVIWCIQ